MSPLDLVWASYKDRRFLVYHVSISFETVKDASLKTETREKRGNGVQRHVVSTAVMPGNWQSFLRVDVNKDELFTFLSAMLVQSFQNETKEPVVTDGEAVICLPRQTDEKLSGSIHINTFQKVINGVGWLDDCHVRSSILYDAVPLFVYIDQQLCHCIFICSNVHWQLAYLLRYGFLHYCCLLAELYETINQTINHEEDNLRIMLRVAHPA